MLNKSLSIDSRQNAREEMVDNMADLNAWKQQWNVFHYQFPCCSG